MHVSDALHIKSNDRVWLTYTPTPGHGPKLNGCFTVKHVGQSVNTNIHGVEYVWVSFRNLEGVYGSHYISRNYGQ